MENEKKPRLLLVLKMLQKTDVEHPLNTTEIINKLKQCGVDTERKAVLRDLKALQLLDTKLLSVIITIVAIIWKQTFLRSMS